MDSCLDKVESFFNSACVNVDQSVYDVTASFLNVDHSCSSKHSFQNDGNCDPFVLSFRDWLQSRSQRLNNEQLSFSESKTDLVDCGLNMMETVAFSLETINQNKEELRQNFKHPQADNTLPIHFDLHKNFLNMITCLSQVGSKYEDYSKFTADQTTQQMKKHLAKLDMIEKTMFELQHLSLNTAGDTEKIRKKAIGKRISKSDDVY